MSLIKKEIILSASIMCANLFKIKEDLKILQKHNFNYLHIDIMDGHFVPNIALGFDFTNRIGEFTSIPKDIHLMMDYPDIGVRSLKFKESDLITFHIECRNNPFNIIKNIKDEGGLVGIAINPATPIEKIYPFLDKIDHVLIMTIDPGFSGQPFVKTSYERVRMLSKYLESKFPKVTIGVDGAIGLEKIMEFYSMDVNHFVLGTTALFKKNLNKQAIVIKDFIKDLKATKEI